MVFDFVDLLTCPCDFHSLKSNSICQRSLARDCASFKDKRSFDVLVTIMFQSQRANRAFEGFCPLRLASAYSFRRRS